MPIAHLALVYLVCVVWAFNFIAVSTALLAMPPILFTVVRFVLVLVILLPSMRRPARDQWSRLLVVCWSNGALHFAFLFWALRLAGDVSSVAILLQTYVPIATVMAVIVLNERIGWRTISAVILAFSGVLCVSFDPSVFARLDALALALTAATFLAFGTTLMRGLKGVDALSFQGWTAALSLPLLLPLHLVLEWGQWPTLADATWIHWGGVVYSALVASIIGHGLLFYLVQRHPISDVMPHMLITPILAVVFGVVLWGDELGWRLTIGGIMVLGGVLIVSLRARTRIQHVAK